MAAISSIGSNPEFSVYPAVLAASKDNVKVLEPLTPRTLSSTCQVHPKMSARYAPLHCALSKRQWKACALLLNKGVDWNVLSTGVENPKTPIELLNQEDYSLFHILCALLSSGQPIQVEPLVDLLISPQLNPLRRQEVWQNLTVCKLLADAIPSPQEALLVLACLTIGSFQWKTSQTEAAVWLDHTFKREEEDDEANFRTDGTMCCYELFLLLSSLIAHEEYVSQVSPPPLKSGKPTNRLETEKQRIHCLAKILGCPFTEGKRTAQDFPNEIRMVYAQNQEQEVIAHYLLAFPHKGKKLVIHINNDTTTVVCQELSQVISDQQIYYLGMLPWLTEKEPNEQKRNS